MRPGGGAAKGAAFEREVASALSRWVSGNQRTDLFRRSVLSGGSFTVAQRKDIEDHGTPGDIMATHPLAFGFATRFAIECKHKASLDFEMLLFNPERSFLVKTFEKTQRDASKLGQRALVVAKQNRRPTVLFTARETGEIIRASNPRSRLRYVWHAVAGEYFMMEWEMLLRCIRPDALLTEASRRVIEERSYDPDC